MLAAMALVALANVTNKYMVFVPMIGLGIAWTSARRSVHHGRKHGSQGTRRRLHGNLEHDDRHPNAHRDSHFWLDLSQPARRPRYHAIIMAGTMLAWGAIAMLWVKDPDAADDSPIVPLATHRHITVYNRVVVGSDGSPSSLHAVAMAAGVANAADAHLVVVSAYNPQAGAGSVGSPRKELRAEEDARSVLRAAVAQPTSERTRQIDQRIVAGDPASALLWNHRDESRRACWQTNAREAVACIE
jgi:maltose/moltooligosaccharide transporter